MNANSSTSICVNWTLASSTCSLTYYVSLYDNQTGLYNTTSTQNAYTCFFSLAKYHAYYAMALATASFSTTNSSVNSSTVAQSAVVLTLQDSPSAVGNLQVIASDSTTLIASWSAPTNANGVLQSYVISWYSIGSAVSQSNSTTVPYNQTVLNIGGLQGCTSYNVTVIGVTISNGTASSSTQTTLAASMHLHRCCVLFHLPYYCCVTLSVALLTALCA